MADVVIPATGHSWGEWTVVKEATEEEKGLEQRICANDSSHEETRTIPKLSHVHDLQPVQEKAATCEEAGNKAYYECSKCRKLYADEAGTEEIDKEETVIHALGHTWNAGVVTKKLTLQENGKITYTCADCGTQMVKEILPTAEDITRWINELPATAGVSDKETVEAVRNAYDRMNQSQKALVTVDTLSKLETAEAQVAEAESAEEKEEAEIPKKVSIAGASVTGIVNKTYTGKALTQVIAVKLNKTTLKPNTDYTVSYKNNINAGKATITITAKGKYNGTLTKTFTIKKAANPLSVKVKTVNVKYVKLSKKKQTIAAKKAFTVGGAQGIVTYKVAKYDKKAKKKINISKTGKITIKKGVKKGTYKLKVKVTAAGNRNYLADTKTVTLKVRIK